MDSIGENEKLLRASKDFQKLDEGKKKRRLLREAQIKDGTLTFTPEQIQKIKDSREIKGKVIQEKFEHRYPTKLSRERRFQYLEKGKIRDKLYKNEQIMLDGAHAEADAKNLANYLKNINMPKYAIWAMMKNKEPDLFIKQFKGIFKKIITIPIENEKNCISAKDLETLAKIHKFNVDKASNFVEAIKKITSEFLTGNTC